MTDYVTTTSSTVGTWSANTVVFGPTNGTITGGPVVPVQMTQGTIICPSYPSQAITIQPTKQETKMETYAWPGLNFVLFCVGIAILAFTASAISSEMITMRNRRKEIKHRHKLEKRAGATARVVE